MSDGFSRLTNLLLEVRIGSRKAVKNQQSQIILRAFFIGLALLVGCLSSIAAARQTSALPVEESLRANSFHDWSSIEVSPDGKLLAYSVRGTRVVDPTTDALTARKGESSYAAKEDVWVLNIETGAAVALTEGSGIHFFPKWSPDGHFVAFLAYDDESRRTGLWIWDMVTNAIKKLSKRDVKLKDFRWMSDSRSVLVAVQQESAYAEELKSRSESKSDADNGNVTRALVGLHLYESAAAQTGSSERAASDPLDLSAWLCDLVRIDVMTSQTTPIVLNRRIISYKLSPDGSSIAYLIPERFERPGTWDVLYDLATVTLATKKEKLIARNIMIPNWGVAFSWSPNSLQISFYTSSQDEKSQDCYVVDAAGGSLHNITKFPLFSGLEHQLFSSVPLWNRRGDHVYFVVAGALWNASISGEKPSQIARIPDHQIDWALISSSNDNLWTVDGGISTVVVARDDVTKQDGFYKIDLSSGRSTKLLERGQCYTCIYSYHRVAPIRNGSQIVYWAEDASHSSDLWVSDTGFKSSRRLTNLNPQFAQYKFGVAHLIDWLGDDGERLQGALLLPSDYEEGKRYPLVVAIYPGSLLSNNVKHFGLRGAVPLENMQILATRGYAVLLPDSPKQKGMGTPMADLVKTVLPGVNRVIELGIADPERLGVIGGSAGGYAVLSLIVQTSRFKAAVDVDGYGDILSVYGELKADGTAFGIAGSSAETEDGNAGLGGTPWMFRDRYIENSPLFYLDRVQTPVLIVHVNEDPIVASFLGDQVFVGLRRLRKEVEYAKYEGKSHMPDGANELDFCNRVIAWFDKYLKSPSMH